MMIPKDGYVHVQLSLPLETGLVYVCSQAKVHVYVGRLHTGLMSERNPLGTSAGSSGLGWRNLRNNKCSHDTKTY